MQEAQNTKIVQEAYAAFGRGDIQGVLATLDEHVTWKPITGAGPHVPHAGERHGKGQIREFFDILGRSLTFDRFEPREFIAQGDHVVVLGHYSGRAVRGKAFESDWAMVFRVRNGKVVHFQEFTDSAAINAAFEAVA
jgi:uncharacterized protein